jgi:STE24 endopeptidase
MNPYAVFILAVLLVDWALGLAADVLNLRAMRREPPEGLRHLYDAAAYRRSQDYQKARTRLGLVASSISLAALLLFWFLGGFGALDRWLTGFELGFLPTGLLYVAILGLGATVISLPFSLWGTFLIEERFGFNRTTPRTFALDLVKGLALAVVLGGPLLAAVLYLFSWLGPAAWLWAWLIGAAAALFFQILLPRFILPLFHRFEPLAEGELRDAILGYTCSVGYRVEGIFVADGSRRSTKANAFFTGLGRHRRIALYDTLIEKHSVPEVVAVVAHEVGHDRLGHVTRNLVVSIAHLGLMLWILSLFLFRPGLYEAFGIEGTPLYAGLVLFGLLYTPVERLLSIGFAALSRRHELQADRFAAQTTGQAEALASALEKLAADQLTNLSPHPFQVALRYSHPPLAQRLGALRQVAPAAG